MVEVQVGQQDVQLRRVGLKREPEAADPRSRVEREQRAVGERDLHARGVAPVAQGLGPGGGDRAPGAPELHPHAVRPLPRIFASTGQKTARAPRVPCGVVIGIAEASTSCMGSVGGADREVRVGGAAVADRLDERQLLVGDRLAIVVKRPEDRAPLLRPDRAELLEALPEQPPGRLVVEDEQAALVNQEGRRRKRGHEVAGEDQLDRLLAHVPNHNPDSPRPP